MKKLAVLFDVEYHGNDWVGDTLPGIYLDIRLTLNVLAFDVKGKEENFEVLFRDDNAIL